MTRCLGCGIKLQNESKDKLGYTLSLENNICERCFKLKNYGKYTNVSLNNTDYLNVLNSIKKDDLVVYTTDILSLSINLIETFERVLLVITKRDILPKSIKDEKIVKYIKKKYPNVIGVIVVSSNKNYNLDYLYDKMKKYSNKKGVYLVGNTNSGKSTLINKLIDNYSINSNNKVTTSMYPATTLDKLEINLGDLILIDTPGLIEKGNIVNYLDATDMKSITPKKEIKPKSCQISGIGSLVIDKYIRIDYHTKKKNSLVIYASNTLNIRFSSLKKEISKDFKKIKFDLKDRQDIVIPGLGFIKFVDPFEVSIYCNSKVKPYSRDNLI